MTGDKLRQLEEGFVEGSLTDQEETELRGWVKDHPDHDLAPYFQWTSEEIAVEIPDFREVIGHRSTFWRQYGLKIAAALLVIITAGFLWTSDLNKSESTYSQAEIDKSYEATMETLTAMSDFLNQGLKQTNEALDLSQPFEELKGIKNANSQ